MSVATETIDENKREEGALRTNQERKLECCKDWWRRER
jgi:hypothetical protein